MTAATILLGSGHRGQFSDRHNLRQEWTMLVMMMLALVGVASLQRASSNTSGCGAACQRPRRLTSKRGAPQTESPWGYRSEYSGYRRKHVEHCRFSLTFSGDLPASSCTAARIQSRAICRKSSLSSSGSASVAQRRHSSANFLYSWT